MITTTDTLADFIARHGPPTITMGVDEVQHHWYLDSYVILAEREDGTRGTSTGPLPGRRSCFNMDF